MMTLFAPVARTVLTRVCIPATGQEIPAVHEEPPLRQHCQAAVSLGSARSGYGSLNRSKITASLPLNAGATEDQNGTDCAESGIGFWQVASAEEQPDEFPVYTPSVQCSSTIATIPLEFSRFT